jgi:anti-sigma factor RsiW
MVSILDSFRRVSTKTDQAQAYLDRAIDSSLKPEDRKLVLRYLLSVPEDQHIREFARAEIERVDDLFAARKERDVARKGEQEARKSEQLAWEAVAKVTSERFPDSNPFRVASANDYAASVGGYLSATSAFSTLNTVNTGTLGSRTNNIQWLTVSANSGLIFATSPVATPGLLSAKTASSLTTY